MKDDILRLRAEGYTYNQIVETLGCSKGTVAYHCGAGQKEKTRTRNRDRRSVVTKYVQEYKQSRGCEDCGEDYPYWMLDFDHVRGEKIGNISMMKTTNTFEEILEEIKKCDVVCANCHRIRTWSRLVDGESSILDIDRLYEEA